MNRICRTKDYFENTSSVYVFPVLFIVHTMGNVKDPRRNLGLNSQIIFPTLRTRKSEEAPSGTESSGGSSNFLCTVSVCVSTRVERKKNTLSQSKTVNPISRQRTSVE